jgi:hypothetical protein
MHAVVIEVEVGNLEDARRELTERVVPTVRQAPGFVSGVWYEAGEGRGRSVVVFETEEAANAMAAMARDNAPAAVTVHDISVRQVVAQA